MQRTKSNNHFNYWLYSAFILFISIALSGGFFDYSVAIIGVLSAVCLFIFNKNNLIKKSDKKFIFLIPLLVSIWSLTVCIWSVDYMENLMGTMRGIVVVLWMGIIRSIDVEDRIYIKAFLPYIGAGMVIISLIINPASNVDFGMWENSRLSGFFQYSNTCGLFLAICIIFLVINKSKKIIIDIALFTILSIGLLLSGSRIVILLFLIWGLYQSAINKKVRKKLLLLIGVVFIISALSFFVFNNTNNIGRIFSVFSFNSTFWGRLLYYRDLIVYIPKHLFGIGRMGYYYMQGTFQTGVYSIRFVHNEALQMLIDYGISGFALVFIFLGWQIIKGKQSRSDKEILVFILLCSLMDFHFQFLSIILIMSLLFDYGDPRRYSAKEIKENKIILLITTIVFCYIGVATSAYRLSRADIASSLIPGYTIAEEKLMYTVDYEKGVEIANDLLEKNPHNKNAYIYLSGLFLQLADVDNYIDCMNHLIDLDPYNIEHYRMYDEQLNGFLIKIDDKDKIAKIKDEINGLETKLIILKERTSPLAYKIKDKPEFSYQN